MYRVDNVGVENVQRLNMSSGVCQMESPKLSGPVTLDKFDGHCLNEYMSALLNSNFREIDLHSSMDWRLGHINKEAKK
jgi:hypothetical protein